MTLTFHGFALSNFVRTVRMIAEERGIAYELNPYFPGSDEAKANHPLGQVPVMDHDGFRLFETLAIADYLQRNFEGPSFFPEDPKEAALVNQWSAFVTTYVDQILMRRYVVQYAFVKDSEGNTIRTLIDMAVPTFDRLFPVLDDAVAPGYLGGDKFNQADCFFAPILNAATMFPEAQEHFGKSKNLQNYMERIRERASFIDTAPE